MGEAAEMLDGRYEDLDDGGIGREPTTCVFCGARGLWWSAAPSRRTGKHCLVTNDGDRHVCNVSRRSPLESPTT